MPDIKPLSWSSAPGGGWGACIDYGAAAELPELVGATFPGPDSKDVKVIRVHRLFRDAKGRKPANRVILVVREQAALDVVLADRRSKEPKRGA